MAELKPIMGRLVRLDGRGQPIGESKEFTVATLALISKTYDDSCAPLVKASHAFFDLSFTMQTSTKQLRQLAWSLFADEVSRRALVRTRRYYGRTHGHAPRRRYKHGRVGVKRAAHN